jgi:UPF0716 protein FxsA
MWVLLAILAVPLIEIGLFVTLGGAIGLWPTLAWVLISAALGLMVLKGVAMTGAVSMGHSMKEMGDPLSPLAHRAMVVMAGALLLLPGFLTDAFGLVLLIPPVRSLFIKFVGWKLGTAPVVARAEVVEGEWSVVEPGKPSDPPLPPESTTRH